MEQTDPMTKGLASVIAEALAVADISLREAAARTGIPTTTLHRRLNAVSPLLITELNALAAILDTTPEALVAKAHGRTAA